MTPEDSYQFLSGINTGGRGGGGGSLEFPPYKNTLLQIWLNYQWFMMAFMMMSMHIIVIIKLMFQV